MTISNKNFAYTMGLPQKIEDGTTFIGCNFMQEKAGTLVFEKSQKLTFIDCQCRNCVFPKDTVLKNCCTVQRDMESPPTPDLPDVAVKKAVDMAVKIHYKSDPVKASRMITQVNIAIDTTKVDTP
jgi:hypothetical protein